MHITHNHSMQYMQLNGIKQKITITTFLFFLLIVTYRIMINSD